MGPSRRVVMVGMVTRRLHELLLRGLTKKLLSDCRVACRPEAHLRDGESATRSAAGASGVGRAKILSSPRLRLPSVHQQPTPSAIDRDNATLALFVDGNPEGLRRLLLDHGGRIRWTLEVDFKRLLNRADIDDAMSQASQRVWRARQRFDPRRGTLRAWFYVIARNCALRILEAKTHSALKFVGDMNLVVSKDVPPTEREFDVPASPQRQRFVHDLHRCIAALPGQQRDVILADLAAGGLADTKHLVADLDTTPASIYASRAKARAALRHALSALGHPSQVRQRAYDPRK